MLVTRLAAERAKVERPEGTGDMHPMIDEYVRKYKAEHREKAWYKSDDYTGAKSPHSSSA